MKEKLVGSRDKSNFISQLKNYEPKLNTSKVKLPAVPATVTKKPAPSKATFPPKAILLIDLGEKNPGLPMLVNDRTIEEATKQYSFLVLEGFAKPSF